MTSNTMTVTTLAFAAQQADELDASVPVTKSAQPWAIQKGQWFV